MNEEQKDKGLKKAIKEENGFRLPSNFAYHTMRKVEEAIRLREKKSERRTLFATIAASIFLIGCCIAGLIQSGKPSPAPKYWKRKRFKFPHSIY